MWNEKQKHTDECTLQLLQGPLLVCACVCMTVLGGGLRPAVSATGTPH